MRGAEIIIDNKRLIRKLRRIDLTVRGGDKMIRSALRKGVTPWKDVVNGGFMYRWLKRKTNRLQDPFGSQTWYAPVKNEYGAKVRPVPARKGTKNDGWRAHFFASPAVQISGAKKVPFNSAYESKKGEVLVRTARNLVALVKRYFI